MLHRRGRLQQGPRRSPRASTRSTEDADAYAEYLSWKASGLSSDFRALLDALRESAFSRLCNALGWVAVQLAAGALDLVDDVAHAFEARIRAAVTFKSQIL